MSKETERLVVGMRHRLQLRVDERLTVPALSNAFTGFTDMPPVFATAFMMDSSSGRASNCCDRHCRRNSRQWGHTSTSVMSLPHRLE